MTTEPTPRPGVTRHLGTGARWFLGGVGLAVIGLVVNTYGADIVAMLPGRTAEGEIPKCGAPVTDVGVFTVQVESIAKDADSAVAQMFAEREFCLLPPDLRPGATGDVTAVMLDGTYPTHAGAFLAACKFADEVRPHVDDLRNAGTGVRSRPSSEEHSVDYISAGGQECRGALPRSIADPAEFVRTYFDIVGNQDRTNELSAWLSDGFLERTTPEAAARYWKDQVAAVGVADYRALPEPAPETGAATVAIRLCVDEASAPNKPVNLQVALVHDATSWQIDRVDEQQAEPNHCHD